MQVEHPNIVKFHKYWLDMKESQARVRMLFLLCALFKHTNSCCRFPTGYLHHRVHVLWQPEAISQENKEKSQDHECEGQPLHRSIFSTRLYNLTNPLCLFCLLAFSKYTITKFRCTLFYILGLEEMVYPDSVCSQVQPDSFLHNVSLFNVFTRWFVVSWQLPALLRPAHNPRKPNLWHHLYSAQRPYQDRLRSAPSWDVYVTAIICVAEKKSQCCFNFFPQCGIGYSLTVRSKSSAPAHILVSLVQLMYIFFLL